MANIDLASADPSRIPDDQWEFESWSADGLRATYVYWVDRENGIHFRKTVNLVEPALIEANREAYNDSANKRFGDGRVVARVPLNTFYRDFGPRLKEGDNDFTKWWLDREENRPFRSFRGKF